MVTNATAVRGLLSLSLASSSLAGLASPLVPGSSIPNAFTSIKSVHPSSAANRPSPAHLASSARSATTSDESGSHSDELLEASSRAAAVVCGGDTDRSFDSQQPVASSSSAGADRPAVAQARGRFADPTSDDATHHATDTLDAAKLPMSLRQLLRNPPSSDHIVTQVLSLDPKHVESAWEWSTVLRTALQMRRQQQTLPQQPHGSRFA
ncbi:uncharacterized protein SPSC_03853 [Sporisorium scitamineum]|uniref:Uncharacterized protein n=1 Tax=Sporisorium scitamineum TaxID=49012 RepID=A0A0F7RZM7_9BASI|nr:uncharacterized protein SPSC_03853 [Sporisorium scitamineum]CDS00107.1 hypothetical protein [Sporisorium scitamineum]